MKKSRRQVKPESEGRDVDLSQRFEARNRKRAKRRKGEKAGRKAARK